MLVLSRRVNEQIQIGPDVTVTVVEIDRHRVRLGIAAPESVVIDRPDAKCHDCRLRREPDLGEANEQGG